MKDLKTLTFYEELIAGTDNDCLRAAREDGRLMIGYNCNQLPEVLLDLPGCVSVRMRAPGVSSMDVGTYYMTSLNCEYCRAIVEMCFDGGYNFLDCVFDSYACSQMADAIDNIDKLGICRSSNSRFFVARVDTPIKSDENAVRHLARMCKARVLDRLHDEFGIDVSDEAILKAVEEHNRMCALLNEIGSYRKLEHPVITGYEFAVICLATYSAPHDIMIGKLRETLAELKTREADPKDAFRIRVVVAGSEVDDPDFIKMIESTGALVVADRYCFGSFPDRMEISLPSHEAGSGADNASEDLLTSICRQYVKRCQCPRHMDRNKIDQRKDYLAELVREYNADGIIVQQMNFCNFWPYERAAIAHIIPEKYDIPVLSMDRPYSSGMSGQLRTRVQAFIESTEIKRLRKGMKHA
ncbi:MAG: 2-hydroxyacyl-CoA dehydratase [Mogibacterium sp.]|nr:2-hydroxyacyl-CoA dehydratase [Mogibacterium sp.]MBR4090930.1 2-hydroxyacyl-CoA dehydratase [Mogibacterium sp.]